jgi:hypothetical protein
MITESLMSRCKPKVSSSQRNTNYILQATNNSYCPGIFNCSRFRCGSLLWIRVASQVTLLRWSASASHDSPASSCLLRFSTSVLYRSNKDTRSRSLTSFFIDSGIRLRRKFNKNYSRFAAGKGSRRYCMKKAPGEGSFRF